MACNPFDAFQASNTRVIEKVPASYTRQAEVAAGAADGVIVGAEQVL